MESKQKKDSKEISKPNVLYNKEWNDYAYWNGSQYVGKIVGANFYTLEKAVNNGYLPLNSTREQALTWWNTLPQGTFYEGNSKNGFRDKYYSDRISISLTGREIEEIYNKEVLEPKRQEEWQESQVNCRYTKPNAKEFKQFDESLFRAYIDKFSTEDLYKAFKIIGQKLGEFSE